MRWNVMNILLVMILILTPHQMNRVVLVTCQESLPAHTPKMLVPLNILTIFVVFKVISILFTWFPHDDSSELQLYEVWGVIKCFRYKEIRHRKEIYQSKTWDCSTTVSPLCEWPCWTLGLLVYVSVNELTQIRRNFSFFENTCRVILGLFDCQQSDIIFTVYKVLGIWQTFLLRFVCKT